jgi:hypothetical protein
VNGRDAFEEEMLFRTLSDEDVEQLLRGRAPEGSEFVEVAEFAQAVRHTLAARPKDGSDLVRQLAEAARSASPDDAVETTPIPVPTRARTFRLMPPRLVAVARVTVVLALVPMLFAGLAIAGVSLPEPARKAFEVVGVDLPNQPADDGQNSEQSSGAADETGSESGDDDGSAASEQKAEKEKGQRSDADKRGHGTEKANPARAGGRANGEQGRGRALGKRGLAPGQLGPPGQLKKDEGGKAVGKTNPTPPGRSAKPSTPEDNGNPAAKGTSGGGGKSSKPAKSPKG